jgi:hypothetical protein
MDLIVVNDDWSKGGTRRNLENVLAVRKNAKGSRGKKKGSRRKKERD